MSGSISTPIEKIGAPRDGGEKNRRSARVLLHLPIVISGLCPDGASFEALGETLMVNAQGAKIHTLAPLSDGMQVTISIQRPHRVRDARVVWTNERQEFGIELANPGNFWGIYFPPTDWNEPSWTEDDTTVPMRKETAAALRVEAPKDRASADRESVGAEGGSPKTRAGESDQKISAPPAFEAITGATEVVVAGMAAAYMPFQERSLLKPISREQGTVLLRPVISTGALLRIVLPDQRVVRARCIGMGRQRVNEKWKVWVNYLS